MFDNYDLASTQESMSSTKSDFRDNPNPSTVATGQSPIMLIKQPVDALPLSLNKFNSKEYDNSETSNESKLVMSIENTPLTLKSNLLLTPVRNIQQNTDSSILKTSQVTPVGISPYIPMRIGLSRRAVKGQSLHSYLKKPQ